MIGLRFSVRCFVLFVLSVLHISITQTVDDVEGEEDAQAENDLDKVIFKSEDARPSQSHRPQRQRR